MQKYDKGARRRENKACKNNEGGKAITTLPKNRRIIQAHKGLSKGNGRE